MEIYFTIQQIKDANRAIGNHWFDNSTLRFFRSRSSGPVIANMFVSSERFLDAPNSANRRYTIRRCDAGRIETVGELQQYGTKAAALRAIREIAKQACSSCGDPAKVTLCQNCRQSIAWVDYNFSV